MKVFKGPVIACWLLKEADLLHKQQAQRPPPHAAVARRALREMPSPGKSGSVFFLSDDDRFLIKTVSHEEMLLLLKLIPAYYRHCAENPTTLLTRFFGVHRVKPLGSQSKAWLPSCLRTVEGLLECQQSCLLGSAP